MSDKTSKIIKEFICNESKDKSKPVIVEEGDQAQEDLSLQLEEDDMYDVTDIVMDRPDLSSLVVDTQRSTSLKKMSDIWTRLLLAKIVVKTKTV